MKITIDPYKTLGPVKPVNGVEPFYRLGVSIENYATTSRYRIWADALLPFLP